MESRCILIQQTRRGGETVVERGDAREGDRRRQLIHQVGPLPFASLARKFTCFVIYQLSAIDHAVSRE